MWQRLTLLKSRPLVLPSLSCVVVCLCVLVLLASWCVVEFFPSFDILCRYALTLHSKQIKTFGEGWEEEVPAILRSDMRNLTDTAQGDAGPMNLQQRVIQSGLDSIQGPDAPSIVLLFKASAIFAEDCSVSNKCK